MILLNPIKTEKAIKMMEFDKIITFRVDKNATKKEIKNEVEKIFNVKVVKVNINTANGQKKALVRLAKDTNIDDLAGKLKLI